MPRLINHSDGAPGHIVATFDDVVAGLRLVECRHPIFWSPRNAASTHGVLWFAELQRQITAAFPDRQPLIALDCGDRPDLAHAAMCEGLRIICFRGTPRMLGKLQSIAGQLGARIEETYPDDLAAKGALPQNEAAVSDSANHSQADLPVGIRGDVS